MDDWLKTILRRIAEGTLLPLAYYAELDCDGVLDARDRDQEFEERWNRLSQEVERRWVHSTIRIELLGLAEDIRRESFLAVSRAAEQHEIASYVSDDLDLIVRGRLVELSDSILDQLWHAYDSGRFPTPPLRLTDSN